MSSRATNLLRSDDTDASSGSVRRDHSSVD